MTAQEAESVWKAFYQWQSKQVPSQVPESLKAMVTVLKYEIEEGKLSIWSTPGGHSTHQIASNQLRSKEEIAERLPDFAETLLKDEAVTFLRENDSVVERMVSCYGNGKLVLLPSRYFDNILSV